ncbi:MAG TPA: hypothetical protein VE264_01490 [Nitrososphaera sp.]|jgi:hypothetical protein|nr:hypothetical protein [Nitrososphaera sp.]
MTDWSVIFNKYQRNNTFMRRKENGDDSNNISIITEERIKINIEYLGWLYTKSRERKKQNKDLLNNRRAMELVIRDAGGENALKEMFLKEQAEKTIEELAKLDPLTEQIFKQDTQACLQALSLFLVDLETDD